MIPLYQPYISWRHRWAVARQLLSGWLGPGKTAEAFAALMCETVGRQHCALTNSGTSALMLAYLALDLKPGANICLPAYGFPAAHNAAKLLGHRVTLVDVNPATGCMDFNALDVEFEKPPPDTVDCVVFVNHNGCTGEIKKVRELCDECCLPLIEDSAVALGIPGAGITGDLAIYSFSVPKIVTTGQGGAVLTDKPELAERLNQLVDQGGNWRHDRIHKAIGGNFRMADLNAALGLAQLRDLPRLIAKRNRLWGWYREHITIHNDPGAGKSGWMVTSESIIHGRQLYTPVNFAAPYNNGDNFPGANEYYNTIRYVPSSLSLTKHQVWIASQL